LFNAFLKQISLAEEKKREVKVFCLLTMQDLRGIEKIKGKWSEILEVKMWVW